jgi:uncharacterized protein YcbX
MQGEQVQQADLTSRGLVGDRGYALVDSDTGKVASAKSVKLFPGLLNCRAAFVEPPQAGGELPPVRITLPDGTAITSGSGDADRVLSTHFGRAVTLARAAPPDFTIDQYHPDLEGIDPAGHRDTFVESKLGAAYFADAGAPSPVPAGAFFDLFPLSVITTSTLERLAGLRPGSRFDPRRFRMNVILATTAAGFVENDWLGREVALGDTARLRVVLPDPRCVMTTLAQDGLPGDTDVLRTLAEHNKLEVGGAGRFPCAGVYAVVERPGIVTIGDRVFV